MANVTADEVRYIGGYSTSDYSDALVGSAAFIGAGDAWLNQIVIANGSASLAALTTSDANKGALAKAAECWYVAMLLALSPPPDDFSTGGVQSKSNAKTRMEIAQKCFEQAKEMLSQAGMTVDDFTFGYTGGKDYSASGYDDSNVDFGQAGDDDDQAFNLFTVES